MSAIDLKRAAMTTSSGRPGDRFDFEAFATGARSVLEIGCGKAGHVPGLATRCGFGSYVGVDIDEAAVSAAAASFASDRLRFARCDVLGSDWPDGTFDLIFAPDVFVLLDHASKEEVLRRCADRLAPGGSIVVNEFNHRVLVGNALANAFRGQLNRVAYFVGRTLAILAPGPGGASRRASRRTTSPKRPGTRAPPRGSG